MSAATTRPPVPFNVEAEEAVVASLLVDETALARVRRIVEPGDFLDFSCRLIFGACVTAADRGGVNQITVAHELGQSNGHKPPPEGWPAFLSQLVVDLPTPVGVESYAKIVHDDAIYRQLIGASGQIAEMASRGGADLAAIVKRAQDLIGSVAEQAQAEAAVRFQTQPLAGFMAKKWGAGETLIEEWLSTGNIAFLYGQINDGKTLEACEFALSIGTGRPLFGHFPTVQGTVLLVEEDCHPQKLQPYLGTLMEAYGIEDAPIFIWERQFLRLDDEAAADAFFEEVLRLKPVLIILDAFLDLHSGDGFTGRELRPILDRIAALPQLLPCAVLVLDATRKEMPGAKLTDPIDALYGGRMKSALADTMILTKKVDEVPLRFDISMPKTRDEPRAPIQVTFSSEDGFVMEDTPPAITPSARTIFEWAKGQPAALAITRKTIEVTGDHEETVEGEYKLTVEKDITFAGSANMTEDIAEERTIIVGKKLTIECGEAKVTIESDGKIEIEGADITVKGSGKVKVEGDEIEVKASGKCKVEGSKVTMN